MLIVRSAQLAAMEQLAQVRVERALLGHLRDAFPREFARLGDPPMTEVIRLAMSRAARHGHTTPREFFLFATLMLMLGAYFDEDPQFAWLARRMDGVTHAAPPERLDDAHAAVMQYLDEIAGPENEHLIRALVRMREIDLASVASLAADMTGAAIAGLLAELFPEKARCNGDAAMRLAVAQGRALAGQHAMQTGEGVVLFSALVFMLGWRFNEDPVFPWARTLLAPHDGAPGGDAPAAVAALHRHALGFLRYGLGADGN
ncbi:MAG TPA: hypothetical protein VGG99_10080 [Acetobacteraceae bacterium]|jgi:hypothetical protein